MSNQRITPHRAKREEAKSKVMADLKRENNKLKRTVKRLEKERNRLESMATEAVEKGIEEDGERVVKITEAEHLCPTCNSDVIRSIVLLGHTYKVCRDCGWRARSG